MTTVLVLLVGGLAATLLGLYFLYDLRKKERDRDA